MSREVHRCSQPETKVLVFFSYRKSGDAAGIRALEPKFKEMLLESSLNLKWVAWDRLG